MERSRIIRAIDRIEKSLKGLVETKEAKSVSLRLDPPSLGSMTVEISFRDGELHARLAPELPQVAAVLRERSHELHAALRKMGLSVDQVRVSIESGRHGFDSGSNGSSRDGGQRGAHRFDGSSDWGAVESDVGMQDLSNRYGVGSIESGWVA
jgi:flagellar hook-length control protein FliK